jgi:hypothetical protein
MMRIQCLYNNVQTAVIRAHLKREEEIGSELLSAIYAKVVAVMPP